MEYRRIGGTDLDVSVLCFGSARSATPQGVHDDASRARARALAAALDAGINFIHSSREYGTHWIMNEVLREHPRRHELHHVIKVPVPDRQDNGVFDAARFRSYVEDSLRALATERIAVVQWMWRAQPNDDAHRVPLFSRLIDDVAATFDRLRDEGKVGYLMTHPYSPAGARVALDSGVLAGLMMYYNPIEMEMAQFFPRLMANGQSFICIRPLSRSILTDRYASWNDVPAEHHLQRARGETPDVFARRGAVARAFAAEIGDSMTRFALRFPLFSPVVASMITGLNTEQQVESAAHAVAGVAPRPDLVAKAEALWQSGFGLGGA
jgi:aryl-alcohol dehydrogenase-like predicted oxidoreductase